MYSRTQNNDLSSSAAFVQEFRWWLRCLKLKGMKCLRGTTSDSVFLAYWARKKMNKANISQSPWVLYDLPDTINLKFLGSSSVCIHALKSMKSYTKTLGVIIQGFKITYSHLHWQSISFHMNSQGCLFFSSL